MNKNTPEQQIPVLRKDLEMVLSALNGKDAKVKDLVFGLLNMSESEIMEHKKEEKFQLCINNKSKYYLLDEKLFRENVAENRGVIRTLFSTGVYQDEMTVEDFGIRKKSYRNFATNYKSWLGEKLHLTKEEISALSVDEIDSRVGRYLSMAIDHVNRFFDMIPHEVRAQSKSEYFDSIHTHGAEQKTVHELLLHYVQLEKDLKFTKGKKQDADLLRNHKMAQYEIQRIFALAMLYRDREQNHEFQNYSEDEKFIKNKLKQIFEDKGSPLGNQPLQGLKSGSGLYDYTITKKIYITKKTEGGYEFHSEPPKSVPYMTASLNGTTIEGCTDYYKNKKSKVNIRHIGLRSAKDPFSAVNKIIGKYSSPKEILDQKGLIIVLDSYEDSDLLERILVNELGTKETSWVEELEFIGKHNQNSSNSYGAKKGILKISYKAKDRKQKMKQLKEDIRILESKLRGCGAHGGDIKLIKSIRQDIEYLKNRLKNLTYNIEVEVQIFDLSNYIKAEVDRESPAYHGSYKKYQTLFDIFPKLFPKEVYGEDFLRCMLMPSIEEKLKIEGCV